MAEIPVIQNPYQIIMSRLGDIETHLIHLKRKANQEENHQSGEIEKIEGEGELYLSKHKVARLAGVSPSTVDNWARAGKIARYRFGSSVRFNLPELKEFLESQKVKKK